MASHEVVEKNIGLMAILIVIVVSIGGLVEIVPDGQGGWVERSRNITLAD